jgi:hypothetical protein
LSQAYAALQTEYIELKNQQDTVSKYQQAGLMYDPIMGTGADGLDMFQLQDTTGFSL